MHPWDTLRQDTRYALTLLALNPGFAAVAVMSLALGTGANTATLALIYMVLLRALPVQDTLSIGGATVALMVVTRARRIHSRAARHTK